MDAGELDLQHDRRRQPRIRFAKSTPAVLKGYRLICDIASKTRRGGIFNVIPDPISEVHGMIYELCPGDTLSISVLKEGDIAKYSLSVQSVRTRMGEEIPALVLHAQEDRKQLKPSNAYLDIVIKAARQHRLPPEWVQHLETLR